MVSQKLVPALEALGLRGYEVHGLLDDPFTHPDIPVFRHREPRDLARVVSSTGLIPWVATPPFHARSAILQAAQGRRIILEKPLGLTSGDCRYLLANPALVQNSFVLSYYTQAKFAPLLWALGTQKPSPRLLTYLEGDLSVNEHPVEADLVLSEPLTRQAGDTVSSWQQDQLTEFAVHGPATLHALGLPATDLVLNEPTRVEVTGPASRARVSRPGPDRKTLRVRTPSFSLLADGTARYTTCDRGSLGLRADTPSYLPLLAAALDWLEDPAAHYAGALNEQLAALQLLTQP